MNKNIQSRLLTEEERARFSFFLWTENREPLRSLYSQDFWNYYNANLTGMAYFSCPLIYPKYFQDGDLIRMLISEEYEDFEPVFWWFKQERDETYERLTPQTIKSQNNEWECICGNTAIQDGFHPCDSIGSEVEPTPEAWQKPLYSCDRCGRIINQDTLQVEMFRQPNYAYLDQDK